jgi:hypothetical protein
VTVERELYEELDRCLARRIDYYPAHLEPEWGTLQQTLAHVLERLWADAAAAPDGRTTPELNLLAERPIFVVGYYKSGTTLLLNLLDGHPDLVALPGESRHFTARAEADPIRQLHATTLRNAITPYGLPPLWVLGLPWETTTDPYDTLGKNVVGFAGGRGEQDLLAAAAQALAVATGASPRHWVEKTPTHELHVDEIVAAYPQARFVHVLREPHSTVESIARFDTGRPIADPLTAAAELSRSFAAALDGRRRLGDRYQLVRYDELVTDTRGTMERLAAGLGIAFDERLLVPTTLGRPSTANAGRSERRVSGAVHQLSLGDAGGASKRRRMLIDSVVGENARALGFDTNRGSALVAIAARGALFARYRIGAH